MHDTGLALLASLTVKLSLPQASSAYHAFKWCYVLLPEACMLLLCWFGPCLRMYEDVTLYMISMVLAWIPMSIVTLLLVLRLDHIASQSWGTPSTFLLPLWAVDVVVSSTLWDPLATKTHIK